MSMMAPLSDLATVLDQLLTAVAELDELCQQCVGIEDGALGDAHRVDGGGARAEPLQQGANAGHHDGGAAVG